MDISSSVHMPLFTVHLSEQRLFNDQHSTEMQWEKKNFFERKTTYSLCLFIQKFKNSKRTMIACYLKRERESVFGEKKRRFTFDSWYETIYEM